MTALARAALICFAGALFFSACGGGDEPMEDVKLGNGDAPSRGTSVAALGDSISAGSPIWDPDQAVRDTIGSALDRESQYEHWAQLRIPDTRWRNCGVFGERTMRSLPASTGAPRAPRC